MRWWHRASIIMGIAITHCMPQQAESTVQDILEKISLRAHMSQSDALMISYRGNLIYLYGGETCYEPIETRSVTKSIVCLAVGLLMQEGKICSIHTPLYHYFPEWKQGIKQHITLWHVLSNTSGLTLDIGNELYEAPDCVKLALATDVSMTPGTRFFYNNKAINLLSAVVEKASGMRLHEYVKTRLFHPLGIKSDTWLCDTAGNNYSMAHLTISAADLTKIGLVIGNNGCWNNRRLLAQEWINTLAQPSQTCNPFYGLLWWLDYNTLNIWWDESLLDIYTSEGISQEYVTALRHLKGQVFSFNSPISYGNFYEKCASQLACNFDGNKDAVYRFIAEVENKGLPLARWDEGELRSFSARGYLGQQLLVLPQEQLVAVRLAKQCGQWENRLDTFSELERMIEELVQEIKANPSSVEYIKLPTTN